MMFSMHQLFAQDTTQVCLMLTFVGRVRLVSSFATLGMTNVLDVSLKNIKKFILGIRIKNIVYSSSNSYVFKNDFKNS